MGFFGKVKEKFSSRNEEAPTVSSDWDMSDVSYAGNLEQTRAAEDLSSQEQEARKKINAQRQQRKIIAAFLAGENGNADIKSINAHDANISEDDRGHFLDMLAHGQISEAQKRDFIDHINGPLVGHTSAEVHDRLNDKHEKRILAALGGRGFEHWQYTAGGDVEDLLKKYPSPFDFQPDATAFVDVIRRNNGDEKGDQYAASLDTLMTKIYGKKYEYFKQLDELDKEATERHRAQVAPDLGHAAYARTRRRRVQNREMSSDYLVADVAQNENFAREASKNAEQERNQEWMPGRAGSYQISRRQTRTEIINRATIDQGLRADDKCEDSLYVDEHLRVYGVFDGVGGEVGGRQASQLASRTVGGLMHEETVRSGFDLARILNKTNEKIVNTPDIGKTTAVLARMVEQGGQKYLAYASVGDSRIYVVNAHGDARQVTRDEGEGRFVFNILGDGDDPTDTVRQYGEIPLTPGDRVVLCSDGITGDYGDDLMSDSQLGSIVSQARSPLDAAKNLISAARKKDDRTAVVFGA